MTIIDSILGDDAPDFSGALCAQTDPDAFFPEKGGSSREVKRICNGGPDREPCPVLDACLEYALVNDERFGVWGGKSETERRPLRRLRAGLPELPTCQLFGGHYETAVA